MKKIIKRLQKKLLKECEDRLANELLTISELKQISQIANEIEKTLEDNEKGRQAVDIINNLISKYNNDYNPNKPIDIIPAEISDEKI